MAKNAVSKVLEKRGLKPEELTQEEKETIEQWNKTLSAGEVTIDTILNFCNYNIAYIETQFRELDNSREKIERLVLLHSVYSSLKRVIEAPKAEKEAMENYLTHLLH